MMMSDQRQIRFGPEALLLAIGSSPVAAAALGLPPLKPQSVRLQPEANKVEIAFQTGGGLRSVALQPLPLAALLLSFCFRARIPLPRNARKAARIEAQAFVLDFHLDFTPEIGALRPEGAMVAGSGAKSLDWNTGTPRPT